MLSCTILHFPVTLPVSYKYLIFYIVKLYFFNFNYALKKELDITCSFIKLKEVMLVDSKSAFEFDNWSSNIDWILKYIIQKLEFLSL